MTLIPLQLINIYADKDAVHYLPRKNVNVLLELVLLTVVTQNIYRYISTFHVPFFFSDFSR